MDPVFNPPPPLRLVNPFRVTPSRLIPRGSHCSHFKPRRCDQPLNNFYLCAARQYNSLLLVKIGPGIVSILIKMIKDKKIKSTRCNFQ